MGKRKKGDENSKNIYKSLSLFSTFRRMYQLYQLFNNFDKNQETTTTRTRTKKTTPHEKKSKNEFRSSGSRFNTI